MATDLDGIFNVGLNGLRDRNLFDKWLEELKKAEIEYANYVDARGNTVQETGEWSYEISGFGGDDPLDVDDVDMPYCVSFYGPHMIQIKIMDDIAEIPTHYRLKVLFEQPDFFFDFISQVHRVVKIFGATELIWLSSLGSASYSSIYQGLVWENVPYEKVKEALIQQFGKPISYSEAKRIGEEDVFHYATLDKFVLDVIG